MRIPRAAALLVLPLALLLSACNPGQPDPTGSKTPRPDVSATPTPTPTADAAPELPADAVMLVTATATASTGAQLDLRLVVHAPAAWNADGRAGADATNAWCVDEVNDSIYAAQNYSFEAIDYTATPVGTAVWPADEQIWLFPNPTYTTLAATGNITEFAFPVPVGDGDYVPHCKQTAIMTGAGTGTVWLGADQDAVGRDNLPPFHFWASLTYGFNNAYTSDSHPIAYTGCTPTITPLGATMGAPGPGWHVGTDANVCVVGGTTGY